jgi:hypothetical protein
VCKSIKQIGGQYYLKLFLKPFSNKKNSKYKGQSISTCCDHVCANISFYRFSFAISENNGKYKIRGLITGLYKIKFYGDNGYLDTIISNINIQKN